jgi:ABC-type branched-subunit amino acid transport system substrate-binding protein
LVVQDRNPADTYLLSLGEAFRRVFADETHEVLNPPELYNSQLGGVANRMIDIIENICVRQPDIVFFAGRSSDLAAFVEALDSRYCRDEVPVNVAAGADAVEFANAVAARTPELVRGLEANASVTYTSQAHPESWSGAPEYFNSGAVYQFQSRFTRVFPRERLTDGASILGYDAIVLAVKAIRVPVETRLPGEIIQRFNGLNGNDMVAGAGGHISIDRYGNTIDKAVAILQAQPDGTVRWLGLSSSTGSPCVPNPPGQC